MSAPATTMMERKAGRQSIRFLAPAAIVGQMAIGGRVEREGPLGDRFDTIIPESYYGEASWEKAETKILKEALTHAIGRAGLQEADIDLCFSSDLLNQCTASSFAARSCDIPHFGLCAACASFSAGLLMAGMALDAGFARRSVVGVSSHHDSAERQYRFPTELGIQRPPTAQWTVTGAAACVLAGSTQIAGAGALPKVTCGTVGRVIDMGIKDPYDMGSAMAPAAIDTLLSHFEELGKKPEDYDWILTGDLGRVGREIVAEQLARRGLDLGERYSDCGVLIYDPARQDVHAGGSGLACGATVFCGHVLKAFQAGHVRRVLFAGTGALHSPTTYKQRESIPAVCHAVSIEAV